MNPTKSRVSRIALSCVFSASAFAIAMPAHAQIQLETEIDEMATIQAGIPLSDNDCDYNSGLPTSASQCSVIGTRTLTLLSTTRSAFNASIDRVLSTYQVEFDGELQIDGRPVLLTSGASFPPFRDAQFYFNMGGQSVDIAAQYTGDFSTFISNAAPTPNQNVDRPFTIFTRDYTVDVHSIDIDLDGYFETPETSYEFTLNSIDSTAVSDANSVILAGSFHGTAPNGALQFGRLSGTASLLAQPTLTPYPDYFGTTGSALLSPFGLDYQVTAKITTQLDENGLLTPHIEVTDGIEMNGSKITGLAAGTASTDAVNKAQLDAEAQARNAADLALSNDIATEATARAQADTTLNQRIATEESARQALAADLQSEANARAAADLALGTQIGALGTRLDALTTRVETIEHRVDKLDRKLGASTAIAVAMSGNSFLPNTKFNLTANVATYDGAQAGSLQMGAMVSDNVAVNAGVATSFNKGGKTAGRVGFTMGW